MPPDSAPFTRFAAVYDAIYDARGKDYDAEAAAVLEAAVAALPGDGDPDSILDAACGTGRHLEAFARRLGPAVRLAGIDASAAMLAHARRRVPKATLREADLRRLAAEPPDAALGAMLVTCLFGSISYLDRAGRAQALAGLAERIEPGGCLVLEPAVLLEDLRPPVRQVVEARTADGTLVRRTDDAEIVAEAGDETRLRIRFAFELAPPGGATERFVEHHLVHVPSADVFDREAAQVGLARIAVRGRLRVYAPGAA